MRSQPTTRSTTQDEQRVLFVDDEPRFLAGLKRKYRRRFNMVTALGADEGLELIKTQGPFAVVVADFRMPGMNGAEFLSEVCLLAPETSRIMLTGECDLQVALDALHVGNVCRFLNKPCPEGVLEHALHDALEKNRLIVAERRLKRQLAHTNAQLTHLNQELEERVTQRTAQLAALYRFLSALNLLDSIDDVNRLVVETVARRLEAQEVALLTPTGDRAALTLTASSRRAAQERPIDLEGSLSGHALAHPASAFFTSPEELNAYHDARLLGWEETVMTTTLRSSDAALAVLHVVGRPGQVFTDESLAVLRSFCEPAAVAIENHLRREERDRAQTGIIVALARLAEHRDPDTGAHLERVQAYCQLLSEDLSRQPAFSSVVDDAFIEAIVQSSPLHDIGKVGIPDRILLKPGRLTDDEYTIMKRHAAIGGDVLKELIGDGPAPDFLKMSTDIAYHHHERYDGTGYPDGLAGEAIPLSARIMAVADVYDALTSKRVYKDAMSHERASAILVEGSGGHFDPAIIASFQRCEEAFAETARAMADDGISKMERLERGST